MINHLYVEILESHQPLVLSRQRTRSSDSKTSNDSGDVSADDLAALSLDLLRNRAAQRRKDSTGRRSSDGGNGKIIFYL